MSTISERLPAEDRPRKNDNRQDTSLLDRPSAQDHGLARAMEKSASASAFVNKELDRDNPFRIHDSKIHDSSIDVLGFGVASELGKGAVKEVINHPGDLAKTFAKGALIGAALAAPEVSIPALALYGAYRAATVKDFGEVEEAVKAVADAPKKLVDSTARQAKEFAQAAEDLNNPYSQAKAEAASLRLQSFGAAGAETAASMAGAAAGRAAVDKLLKAISASPVAGEASDSVAGNVAKPVADNADSLGELPQGWRVENNGYNHLLVKPPVNVSEDEIRMFMVHHAGHDYAVEVPRDMWVKGFQRFPDGKELIVAQDVARGSWLNVFKNESWPEWNWINSVGNSRL
jgi:hypothetical protein